MPGGWTMSMAWMRMPGQTWPGAAASFLGMWVVMMVAMMLPSLVPMLWRYRQAVGDAGETRLGRLTALVGLGYFVVWTVFGWSRFRSGVALAAVEMHRRRWRAPFRSRSASSSSSPARSSSPRGRRITSPAAGRHPGAAVPAGRRRHGLAARHPPRPPLRPVLCRSDGDPPRLGVMDLRAMAVVTAAITVERLAPAGERVARAIGAVAVGAGAALIARAVALA